MSNTTTTLIEAMPNMRIGECVDNGRHVIKRVARDKWRLGEVGGDWIMSGPAPRVAARFLSA